MVSLDKLIDLKKLPKHVAIIMDGNGRWAKKQMLPRIIGHNNGVKTVKKIVELTRKLNIQVLTLYAFSTENWQRPEDEVSAIMALLKTYLKSELATMIKKGISFRVIGDISRMSKEIQEELKKVIDKTKYMKGLVLNVALNYGSRQEILMACKNLIVQKKIFIKQLLIIKKGIEGLGDYSNEQFNYKNFNCIGWNSDSYSMYILWQTCFLYHVFCSSIIFCYGILFYM